MRDILRTELKYAVSILEATTLKYKLKSVLNIDVNATGDRGYLVRSLYFDTPKNKDYYEKEDGLMNRCKIRLRIYNPNSDTAHLEFKEKENKNQRKRSLPLSRHQAKQMIKGNYECLKEVNTDFSLFLYAYMNEQLYQPRCVVEYDRQAFCVKSNDIRITLDSNLRATEANFDIFNESLALYPVGELRSTVLEVKYNHFLLSYVKDLLECHERMQISASKYCISRSLLLRGDE